MKPILRISVVFGVLSAQRLGPNSGASDAPVERASTINW